jgi:sacsin
MINQLRWFSLLNTEWEHPFDGTIIRIPLRSATQARWSEISKTETMTNDVQDSMDSFAHEMGSSGLLFLKSVQRIVLSINDEQLNEVEVINRHDLTG